MADNWDDDDFEPEPKVAPATVKVSDKWDGEDEDDDDIKDDWDADSEEEDKSKESEPVVKVKKKKTLAQKIAEKEEAAEQERLEQLAQEEEAQAMNTPEGKLAEKMRLQKLAEDNDLELLQELVGSGASKKGGVIDCMEPSTKEEFDKFSEVVLEKFSGLESSDQYQDFAENFVKNLCMSMTVPTLKKVKGHVEAFHSTKLKEDKANAARAKKGKPSTKTSLKFDTKSSLLSGGVDAGFDDMDDFM